MRIVDPRLHTSNNTAFVCHVGYEVTADVVHRLADGIDPAIIIITTTEAAGLPVREPRCMGIAWSGENC